LAVTPTGTLKGRDDLTDDLKSSVLRWNASGVSPFKG